MLRETWHGRLSCCKFCITGRQRDRQTEFLDRSPASSWCQSCSLSTSPSGKLIPTRQWRILLFVLRYSSAHYVFDTQNWDGLCECTSVFKRDWHSLRFLKDFLCLACKPKRGRKHKTSSCVRTHTPCIKLMSVKSRRVLRVSPLALEKWGGGAEGVCGYTLVFHSIIHSMESTWIPH